MSICPMSVILSIHFWTLPLKCPCKRIFARSGRFSVFRADFPTLKKKNGSRAFPVAAFLHFYLSTYLLFYLSTFLQFYNSTIHHVYMTTFKAYMRQTSFSACRSACDSAYTPPLPQTRNFPLSVLWRLRMTSRP